MVYSKLVTATIFFLVFILFARDPNWYTSPVETNFLMFSFYMYMKQSYGAIYELCDRDIDTVIYALNCTTKQAEDAYYAAYYGETIPSMKSPPAEIAVDVDSEKHLANCDICNPKQVSIAIQNV